MTIKHPPLQKQGQRILPPKENPINFNARNPKVSFEFLAGDYCLSKCEIREAETPHERKSATHSKRLIIVASLASFLALSQ